MKNYLGVLYSGQIGFLSILLLENEEKRSIYFYLNCFLFMKDVELVILLFLRSVFEIKHNLLFPSTVFFF